MILVFGRGGQLATELIRMARAESIGLKGVYRAEADIRSQTAVERAVQVHKPTLAVNAAAYNFVDRAESERDAAMAVNARGPGIIAEACEGAGVPMIHISTDYVFDGEKTDAYVEDDEVAPINAYGESKAAGEAAVRGACSRHLVIRTAWLYGAYGSNFLKTVLRLAADRDRIDVVADQRGSPTSTRDLARAILTAASAIERGAQPWGTFHFAGSGETTRYELAIHILSAQLPFTGHHPKVRAVRSADYPTPARRPRNSVLDSSKFAETFGFHAAHWRKAVELTIGEMFASDTVE